nr:MAG TPA: DNA adenine methylase [Caudoviricetes sp.]
MRYGLPYMGSKNAIAKAIVDALPAGEVFVDLFCGGCAVTHAAILSGKYKRFIINDINPQIVQLFIDAIGGKYANEKRWISREDFFRLKDTDAYVKYCWSFGNDGHCYLYGRNIEHWKKALHYARVLGDFSLLENDFGIKTKDAGRAAIRQLFLSGEYKKGTQKDMERLERLQSFQSIQGLERLQSLQNLQNVQSLESLQSFERLQGFSGDYQAVEIPAGAVVYCDIPYDSTTKTLAKRSYCREFDTERFYNWARSVNFPVYVSEYKMPMDFKSIWSKKKVCRYSATLNGKKTTEHLFVHKRFAESATTALQEGDLFAGMEGA